MLPISTASLLPSPSLSTFIQAKWNYSSTQSSSYSLLVSLFLLPNSTTDHHKYWIYQTICQAKSIKFIIKLYTDHNSLWVKHVTFQRAESLKTFRQHARQHSQQQIHPQCKVCWSLYKIAVATSFSQLFLRIQLPLQSSSKICSFISVNFHLPISALLVRKIVLKIPL